MTLTPLDFHLVNDWQRDFPLVSRPFAELAARLGVAEAIVLRRYEALAEAGTVSRVGAVFRPHTLGWSTLAAVAVAGKRLEAVAALVNAYPEINHNYQREHEFNLWFVATAPSRERVEQVLSEIGRAARAPLLDLPMQEDFHIDLGFDLSGAAARPHLGAAQHLVEPEHLQLESADYTLAAALEGGLALVPRPYAALAARLGWKEEAVLTRLQRLLALGVIRRFGVVVRHRELGYRANAMVVWDVPDAEVSQVGRLLARQQAVNLCYRRPRRLPAWPYNLFTMLHGQDRAGVLEELTRLRRATGLEHLECRPLFSVRRFKQCGARYSHLAKVA